MLHAADAVNFFLPLATHPLFASNLEVLVYEDERPHIRRAQIPTFQIRASALVSHYHERVRRTRSVTRYRRHGPYTPVQESCQDLSSDLSSPAYLVLNQKNSLLALERKW